MSFEHDPKTCPACQNLERDSAAQERIGCADLLGRPFAVFTGRTYYPRPGWQGFRGQFNNLDEAIETGKKLAEDEYGWWQVVDLRQSKIIAGQGEGHAGLGGFCPAGPPNGRTD